MLFYLLLIACAIPTVFLLIDLYHQHKGHNNKSEKLQNTSKKEEQDKAEKSKDDLV